MKKYNFLEAQLVDERIHDGEGLCHHATIVPKTDFTAPIHFLNYTILPKGASFGAHTHGDNNELYIVLEGTGHYTENGETVEVKPGDVFVNPAFGTHSIANDSGSDQEMKVLVIEGFNRK